MASPDASRGDENEIASAIARRRRVLTCLPACERPERAALS